MAVAPWLGPVIIKPDGTVSDTSLLLRHGTDCIEHIALVDLMKGMALQVQITEEGTDIPPPCIPIVNRRCRIGFSIVDIPVQDIVAVPVGIDGAELFLTVDTADLGARTVHIKVDMSQGHIPFSSHLGMKNDFVAMVLLHRNGLTYIDGFGSLAAIRIGEKMDGLYLRGGAYRTGRGVGQLLVRQVMIALFSLINFQIVGAVAGQVVGEVIAVAVT